MSIESLTFWLALLGYLGLAYNAGLAITNHYNRQISILLALIIFTHIFLVWSHRYDWQFSQATRNRYAGFIIFHGALFSIICATFSPARIAKNMIIASFFIVSAGASGAVFRYEVVSPFRIPVLLTAFSGIGFIAKTWYTRRASPVETPAGSDVS